MPTITHRPHATLRRVWYALPWPGWALLAGLYAAALVPTFLGNAEWISDSRFYLAWTYRYLGYSEVEAAQLTKSYLFDMQGLVGFCGFCWPPGYEHSFFHGESGAVVGPRLMYPLLSAPFVALVGPPGMLVVPLVSYAIAVVALAVLASRLWGPWWGVAAGAMMLLSAIATRFAGFAMTDALALMFNVVLLLFLPLRRDTRRSDLAWFLVISCLGLFTRQFALTATVGVISAWLLVAVRGRRIRNPWLSFAGGSAALTVVVLAVQDRVAARLLDGDALSLTDRYQRLALERFGVDGLASIPLVLKHIASTDYDWVRKLDMFLVVVLVLAYAACVWRFRSEVSALLVGMSVPTLALTVVIVDPTYFRYFVPLVPLLVLSVLALLVDLFASAPRAPWRSTEAAPGQPPPAAETAAGGPATPTSRRPLPVAGWGLLAGVQALMIFLVVHLYGSYSVPALLIFTLTAVALVLLASHRAGPLAGGLSGLLLILSVTVAGRAGSSVAEAVVLLAVVGALATLPGGGLWQRARGHANVGFALLLAGALIVTHRAITLAVGVVVAWSLVSLRQRRSRNDWTVPAVISVGLGASAFAADMALSGRHAPYRSSWLVTGASDLASVAHRVSAELFSDLARDRLLYAVCLLTIVALIVGWRSEWSWLTVGMLGSAAALLLMGGPGRRFGDLLVAFPVMILMVAEWATRLVSVPAVAARSRPETPPAVAAIPRQRTAPVLDMVG